MGLGWAQECVLLTSIPDEYNVGGPPVTLMEGMVTVYMDKQIPQNCPRWLVLGSGFYLSLRETERETERWGWGGEREFHAGFTFSAGSYAGVDPMTLRPQPEPKPGVRRSTD